VAGAGRDLDLARRAAAVIASHLQRTGERTVLLIDDVHYLDIDTLTVAYVLAYALRTSAVRCVFAAQAPLAAALAAQIHPLLADLKGAGLVHQSRLAPHTRAEVAGQVADLLRAAPEPALVQRVYELGRGLPAVLGAVVEALRRSRSVQVVDRYAYLVPGCGGLNPSADNPLLTTLRELGPDCWRAAKALAVFAPLGSAAFALLVEALHVSEARVRRLLARLCATGAVHCRAGRTWRFVVPFVRHALLKNLGPFERKVLSGLAVQAIWTGMAEYVDPDYFADRVAEAVGLVDADRALSVLLKRARVARSDRPQAVLPWLAAAFLLSRDRSQRASVLLMGAVARFAIGDYQGSVDNAQRVLTGYSDLIQPDIGQEVQAVAVLALGGAQDHRAVDDVATAQRCWPGSPECAIVTRALACGQLDRWQETRNLLGGSAPQWREGNVTSVMLGNLTWALADLWVGEPERFERSLAGRAEWPLRATRRHLLVQVETHLMALLVVGDVVQAEQLLADEGISEQSLPLDCRSMLAAAQGRCGLAIDLARRCIAGVTPRGYPARMAGMYLEIVSLLVARGDVSTAKHLLGVARTARPALAHLLDIAQARIERALGEEEIARARLRACAREAAKLGIEVGLDLVWGDLADLALEADDRAGVEEALAELEHLSRRVPTPRTKLLTFLVRAAAQDDAAAAEECRQLAVAGVFAHEKVLILMRLAIRRSSEREWIAEAYALAGELEATLYRAWLRNLMREREVSIPGRKETVVENERVLTSLAAGGLSNKELAAALRTSEKSVEGRLNRLFSRVGIYSRIELAAAIKEGRVELGASRG
jgi:DNA-binding NarL/FixJ family response regulator